MAITAMVMAPVLGCHSHSPPDAAAVYESVRGEFRYGSLDTAHARAQSARADLARSAAVGAAAWAQKFRLLDAEILTYQGRSREALALLAPDAASAVLGGEQAIEWNCLAALAHAGTGEVPLSEREVREAHRLADTAHSPLIGEVLRTEALLQVRRNAWVEATDLFKQSLKVAREQHDAYLEASDLLNIGYATLQRQHYDEALGFLQEAQDLARPIRARTVVEAALGNIGWAYFALGDFERALVNLKLAEATSRQIGTTSPQIDWLQDTGMVLYSMGDLEQARTYEEEGLRAAYALNSADEIVELETQLGFVLLRQGHEAEAQQHADAAARRADPNNEPPALRARFLQALLLARHAPAPAEKALLTLRADAANDPALRWEVDDALAHHYAVANDARQAERWFRSSIETFDAQRSAVTDEALQLSFFANGETLYRDYAEFLIERHRSLEALQLLNRGRAMTLEEGLGLTRPASTTQPGVNPQAVARRLDVTILFYALGPEKSYLWVVNARHTQLFALPKQATIESLVGTYRKAILRASDPLREANAAATALYDMLVAPAAATITGGRVLLVADGRLHELNFDTLLKPGAAGSHYWIDDVTVINASSIRLQAAVVRSNRPPSLLLIGDPLTQGTDFDALPNASAEVELVQRYFPRGEHTVLTREHAVPGAYEDSVPGRFSYIHFVAHGTASRLSPLDSAVILSPTPEDPAQFKLYARDIMRHELHAQLVTISTCYGAGLRAYDGEGLVGLSWAFLRAGARNVISALWEANDASTLQLMDRLYRELALGRSPDEALHIAKLSLVHSSGVYRKPFYWGAFQLYAGS